MRKFKKTMASALLGVVAASMIFSTACSKQDSGKETETKEETKKEETKEEETAKEPSKDVVDGSKNSEVVIFSVGDNKIYLDEMMYYIMMQEAQMMQTEQMYIAYTGQGYLDQEYSEGVTMRDMEKKRAMDSAVMYEVLYEEALKANMTIGEEDKKQNEEALSQFMGMVTPDQFKVTGLKEESVAKILDKLALSYNYMMNYLDGLKIDKAAVTKDIKKEEYKQYNTEYLFVSTSKADEAGNPVEAKPEDLKAAEDKLKGLLDKAKAGDDFAKLVETDETIVTNKNNFVVGQGAAGPEYEKVASKMKNGDVSDVFKDENGYYIVKMLDNNSSEAYEQACNDAVENEKQNQFTAMYEELKTNYVVEINAEVWDPIVMGKTTILDQE